MQGKIRCDVCGVLSELLDVREVVLGGVPGILWEHSSSGMLYCPLCRDPAAVLDTLLILDDEELRTNRRDAGMCALTLLGRPLGTPGSDRILAVRLSEMRRIGPISRLNVRRWRTGEVVAHVGTIKLFLSLLRSLRPEEGPAEETTTMPEKRRRGRFEDI